MDHRSQSVLANLNLHASERGVPVSHVVSLKLRAVRDLELGQTHYLGGDIYEHLAKELHLRPRPPSGYRARLVHRLGQADLAEHESGPEIFAAVAAFGEAASPFLSVVELASVAGGLAIWLHRKLRKPEQPQSPRTGYEAARYIRIEHRQVAPDGTLKETILTAFNLAEDVEEAAVTGAIERHLKDAVAKRPKIRRGRG